MGVRTRQVWATLLMIGLLEAGSAGIWAGEAASEPDGVDSPVTEAIDAIEEILANPLDNSAYLETSRCLSTGHYRRVEVMNNQVLIFHGRRDEIWLNILPTRCLGLDRDMILSVEKRGMRLCSRDRFRGEPRFRGGTESMPCSLGVFQRTSPENVAAIRDALGAIQRTATVSETVRSAERTEDGDGPEPESADPE